ncbi:MAG: tetratricopeptide repeat protein, partial [Polyangiaceae bacterium]
MRRCLFLFVALSSTPIACASSLGPQAPARASAATQWLDRARTSYRSADFDDARDAARHALETAPNDPEVRELAARIALVRLDFPEALRLTEG